jgi:hypothetical protein
MEVIWSDSHVSGGGEEEAGGWKMFVGSLGVIVSSEGEVTTQGVLPRLSSTTEEVTTHTPQVCDVVHLQIGSFFIVTFNA